MTPVALQCHAHSAATNSRNFRDVAGGVALHPSNPYKKDPVAPILPPCCQRRKSLAERIALHRGVAATLTPIRLHCATKLSKWRSTAETVLFWVAPQRGHSQALSNLRTGACSFRRLGHFTGGENVSDRDTGQDPPYTFIYNGFVE